jgi:VanZ family protein
VIALVISKIRPTLGHPFWKICALLSLALLFYLTLTPNINSGDWFPHSDKLFHFIAFAGTSFLLMTAFVRINRWWIFGAMVILGISIEFAQLYWVNRSFSLFDWYADIAGSLFIALFFKRRPDE